MDKNAYHVGCCKTVYTIGTPIIPTRARHNRRLQTQTGIKHIVNVVICARLASNSGRSSGVANFDVCNRTGRIEPTLRCGRLKPEVDWFGADGWGRDGHYRVACRCIWQNQGCKTVCRHSFDLGHGGIFNDVAENRINRIYRYPRDRKSVV